MHTNIKDLQKLIQAYIEIDITIEYGYIGTGYLNILIVRDEKIVSIGSFLYNFFRESMWERHEPYKKLAEELAKEADKYQKGERDNPPTLCYIGDKLKVS